MASPEWVYNFISRSESVVEYIKRRRSESSDTLSRIKIRLLGSTCDLAEDEELSDTESRMYSNHLSCLITNFVEGCVVGGGLSIAVSTLPLLLGAKWKRALGSVVTVYNFRVSLFLGLLMTLANGVRFSGVTRVPFLRGLCMAVSVGVLPKSVERFLVYFLYTRALEVVWRRYRTTRVAEEDPLVRDSIGMSMVSMGVVTTFWFGWPEFVPKGYLKFLDDISYIPTASARAFGRVCRSQQAMTPCAAMHGDVLCGDFATRFLFGTFFKKAMPFYFKIHQIPLILMCVKRPDKLGVNTLTHFLVRVARSSAFLAVMNTIIVSTSCVVGHQSLLPKLAILPLGGLLSGLALNIEDKSRRLEMALYLWSQATQILVNAITHNRWTPRWGSFAVCAVSMGVLMHEESALRPVYAQFVGKIIDTDERKHTFALM